MNPRDEAEKMRALADQALDRGELLLASLYRDLAAAICDHSPETVQRALGLGLRAVDLVYR